MEESYREHRRAELLRYFDAPFRGGQNVYAYFREYRGPPPKARLRKPIVGPPDQPYAELQWIRCLEGQGWAAAWIYRGRKFLRSWESPGERAPPPSVRFLIEKIQEKAGPRSRRWPVVAWNDDEVRFFHLFRQGLESPQSAAHRRWKEAALEMGVPKESFEVIGWLGGSLDGAWLKATDCFQGRVDGWVRYKGREPFEYGGDNPAGVRQWVEGYRHETDLGGADLLWVVFRDNTAGGSYWNIEQERAKSNE